MDLQARDPVGLLRVDTATDRQNTGKTREGTPWHGEGEEARGYFWNRKEVEEREAKGFEDKKGVRGRRQCQGHRGTSCPLTPGPG